MSQDNQKYWNILETVLAPARQAVGVKFLYTAAQYAASDAPQLRRALTYCTMVRLAGQGKNLKATEKLSSCPGGSLATGLSPLSDYKKSGCSYERDNMNMYQTVGTARTVVQEMKFMDHIVHGLELRPLADFKDADPDVVILVINAYGAMRLIQAYTYQSGYKTDFRMCGNQAFCSELTAAPYLGDDINFSTLCSGTRHRCRWSDNEVGLGLAYGQLPRLIEGLLATLPDAELSAKKEAIKERALNNGLDIDVQPGREYFLRKLKADW